MKNYIKLEFAKKLLGNTIRVMQGEDLISRQDAIDAFERNSVYAWSEEEDQIAHDWALKIIHELPSKVVIKNDK